MTISRPANLADAFDIHWRESPDTTALVVGDVSYSRNDVALLAAKAATFLLQNAVAPGSRIIAQYDASVRDLGVAIAAARLGCTLMPVPKRLGVREINDLMARSDAAVFFHAGPVPMTGLVPPPGAIVASTSAIDELAPTTVQTIVMPEDHCALIGVTSGSTGQPKGVMHCWKAVAWTATRVQEIGRIRAGEAILLTGQGAGAPGFSLFSYMPLVTGAVIVRAPRWDPPVVLQLAERHSCVWSSMVPTMLRMLLDARPSALGDRKLRAMRCITMAGGFMSKELIERARHELGVEVLRMYAMAECMVNASNSLDDDLETRNCLDGKPDNGAELAIFDDNRRRLPTGVPGEIGLKGDSLLLGYLGEPTGKSDLMTRDGFFLSGDIGEMDANGYVRVVGRKKEMINRGGYKIDPSEVEELIARHPRVAKVAVVGYPDPLYSERACAVIEPRPAATLELPELVAFLIGEGLSKEKLPERLELRKALPLTPDGKIRRGIIKAEVGTDPASSLNECKDVARPSASAQAKAAS